MQNEAHQKPPCSAVLPLSLRWDTLSSQLPLKHKSSLYEDLGVQEKTKPPSYCATG